MTKLQELLHQHSEHKQVKKLLEKEDTYLF